HGDDGQSSSAAAGQASPFARHEEFTADGGYPAASDGRRARFIGRDFCLAVGVVPDAGSSLNEKPPDGSFSIRGFVFKDSGYFLAGSFTWM
ncbi:hypothetical protein, partial [Akkermansia sp.]|uniref:hypothetical protein n=1 Tax=Akkermansia sp. TaxID=1872421 RepID=UPI003AB85405